MGCLSKHTFYLRGVAKTWIDSLSGLTQRSIEHLKGAFINKCKNTNALDMSFLTISQRTNETAEEYFCCFIDSNARSVTRGLADFYFDEGPFATTNVNSGVKEPFNAWRAAPGPLICHCEHGIWYIAEIQCLLTLQGSMSPQAPSRPAPRL